MIHYVFTDTPKCSLDDLRHWTKAVNDAQGSFAQRVREHWMAIDGHPHRPRQNSVRGQAFEQCVFDALRFFGIDRDRIRIHKQLSGYGAGAEIDFLIAGEADATALHCKTSIRERGGQPAFSAMAWTQSKQLPMRTSTFLIFVRENQGDTSEQAKRKAGSVESDFLGSHMSVRSILDEDGMAEVSRSLRIP